MSEELRQLDAEIAEKVMGRERYEIVAEMQGYRLPLGYDEEGREKYVDTRFPLYSTDISAAMQVVENLNERGYRMVLTQDWHGNWMAAVWQKDEHIAMSDWHTKTELPLAICRAALAATEEAHETTQTRSNPAHQNTAGY